VSPGVPRALTEAEVFQRICDLLKLRGGPWRPRDTPPPIGHPAREAEGRARRRQRAAEREEREREREREEGERGEREEYSDAMDEEWGREEGEGEGEGSEEEEGEAYEGPEATFEMTRALALATTDDEQLALELTCELSSPLRKLQVSAVLYACQCLYGNSSSTVCLSILDYKP